MTQEIAALHIQALPQTASSRRGLTYVSWLYRIVSWVGYVRSIRRSDRVVGVISGIGPLILTVAVLPTWQGKGMGRALLAMVPGRRYVYTESASVGFYTKMGFVVVGCLGSQVILRRTA
jgi:GNAT superfamily N-acetyltransferase